MMHLSILLTVLLIGAPVVLAEKNQVMWTWTFYGETLVCPKQSSECMKMKGYECGNFVDTIFTSRTTCSARQKIFADCAKSLGVPGPEDKMFGKKPCGSGLKKRGRPNFIRGLDGKDGGDGQDGDGGYGGKKWKNWPGSKGRSGQNRRGARGGLRGVPPGTYVFEIPYLTAKGYFKKLGKSKAVAMQNCLLIGSNFLRNKRKINTRNENWEVEILDMMQEGREYREENAEDPDYVPPKYPGWEIQYDFADQAHSYARKPHNKFQLDAFIRYCCRPLPPGRKTRRRHNKRRSHSEFSLVPQKYPSENSIYHYHDYV